MELGDRTCNHIADFRQFGDGNHAGSAAFLVFLLNFQDFPSNIFHLSLENRRVLVQRHSIALLNEGLTPQPEPRHFDFCPISPTGTSTSGLRPPSRVLKRRHAQIRHEGSNLSLSDYWPGIAALVFVTKCMTEGNLE